jgi:quercetin dioxygenase-like cupin family protein
VQPRIVRPEEVPFKQGSPGHLLGGGTVNPISPALGTEEIKVNAIYFEPGARFIPHSHPYDQIIQYTEGTGIVALDGGPDQIVQTGEFVLLPAGIPHMHGATADGPAVHTSIMRTAEPGVDVTDFHCPIPDSWQRFRP